jgi:hypothetical protein
MQVFFLNGDTGYGWSEKYFWIGTENVPTLISLFLTFVQIRAGMLATNCQILRIRLATQYKRDPSIFDYSGNPSGHGTSPQTVNNDDNAVIIRTESSGVGYNRIFLRGLSDNLIIDGAFSPTPGWQTAFNAFVNVLVNSGNFGVYASVDHPGTPSPLTGIVRTAPRGFYGTLDPGQPLVTGDVVRIAGAKTVGFNGTKNVIMVPGPAGGTTAQFGGAEPQQDPGPTENLTYRKLNFASGPVQQCFYEQFVTRKPGRPFGRALGRRRNQLPLRQ